MCFIWFKYTPNTPQQKYTLTDHEKNFKIIYKMLVIW